MRGGGGDVVVVMVVVAVVVVEIKLQATSGQRHVYSQLELTVGTVQLSYPPVPSNPYYIITISL